MSASNRAASAHSAAAEEVFECLHLLADLIHDFARTLDVEATLRRGLKRIADQVSAEASSLFLLDEDGTAVVCRACFGPVDITGLRLPADGGIVGRSIRELETQMVRDVSKDPQFGKAVDKLTGFTTRSILCAPLGHGDLCLGAIELINKRGGGLFDERDRHLVQALASAAALAVMNAQMSAELVEQQRMRRELELAAEIQRNLLPAPRPVPFPVCGANQPARCVSGDFYDFFPLADGSVCFALGDVSGKGMNAALLMAKTASVFRCLGKEVHDPGRLIARVNAEICETVTRGMFVTMVCGVLDPSRRRVRLANAGHEPPLFRARGGRFTALPASVPPLGIAANLIPETGPPVSELELGGGTLYVFSDGVTEAWLPGGGRLGAEGLTAMIAELAGRFTSPELLRIVVDRLCPAGGEIHDDLTLVAVDGA